MPDDQAAKIEVGSKAAYAKLLLLMSENIC
jgi:hypothetical protein